MFGTKTPLVSQQDFRSGLDYARGGARLPGSPLHGDMHWRGVAQQGLLVSDLCGLGREGRAVAALFGLFHDCRRENDGFDPEHGPRGAEAFLQWSMDIDMPAAVRRAVRASIEDHDGGETTTRKLVGLGWDADRSLLGRVGIHPDADFFSCVRGETFDTLVAAGWHANREPPTWDQIWTGAFER